MSGSARGMAGCDSNTFAGDPVAVLTSLLLRHLPGDTLVAGRQCPVFAFGEHWALSTDRLRLLRPFCV
jgi:hypothetical protein